MMPNVTQAEVLAVELSPRAVHGLAELQAAHDDPAVSEDEFVRIGARCHLEALELPELERVRWGWEAFRFSFRAIVGREPSWAEYVINVRLAEQGAPS